MVSVVRGKYTAHGVVPVFAVLHHKVVACLDPAIHPVTFGCPLLIQFMTIKVKHINTESCFFFVCRSICKATRFGFISITGLFEIQPIAH